MTIAASSTIFWAPRTLVRHIAGARILAGSVDEDRCQQRHSPAIVISTFDSRAIVREYDDCRQLDDYPDDRPREVYAPVWPP